MGGKASKLRIDDAKLSTAFGSCSFSKCGSSCCGKEKLEETPEQKKIAALSHEISMALRYGRNSSDHELLKIIRGIVAETGEIPEFVFVPAGQEPPPMSKRTVSLRVQDHSPRRDAIKASENKNEEEI